MLWLQLLVNGLATGCALGVVAVSFSLIYATTKIFHVAHAGVYTMGGYLAWSLVTRGAPFDRRAVARGGRLAPAGR
jgi:branched-chain amino acid transport system permease protein